VQVSTQGGIDPQWSPDGRELYFFSRDGKIMASAIRETSGSIDPSPPVALFSADPTAWAYDQRTGYAVAPDGRFLVTVRPEKIAADPVVAILGWEALLRK
jgi:hypothetical protein